MPEAHWVGEGQGAPVLLWPHAATLEESPSARQVCSRGCAHDDCLDVKTLCLKKSCRKVFCLLFLLEFNPWRTVAVLERSDMLAVCGDSLRGDSDRRQSTLRVLFLKHLLLPFAKSRLYGKLSGYGRRGRVCSLLCLKVHNLPRGKLSGM